MFTDTNLTLFNTYLYTDFKTFIHLYLLITFEKLFETSYYRIVTAVYTKCN